MVKKATAIRLEAPAQKTGRNRQKPERQHFILKSATTRLI